MYKKIHYLLKRCYLSNNCDDSSLKKSNQFVINNSQYISKFIKEFYFPV